MRSSRVAAATALGLAASVALAGCGVGGGSAGGNSQQTVSSTSALTGSITFQTWSLKNATFTPYFTALISSFEKAHPGTKINWIDQPGDNYPDKVTSQVTGNSLPDVVNLPPEIAHTVAKTGNLLDLTKNDPSIAQTYVASGLSAYVYKDTGSGSDSFAFPWYLGTDVDYWNKTMMAKDGLNADDPPTTLSQLIADAKIMHDKSGGRDYLMSRAPGLIDFANAGAPLLDSAGTRFTFNTASAVAVLQQYTDAYKAGYLPSDVLTSTYEGNSALFQKQEAAWTTGGGNLIESTQQTNPNLVADIVPSAAIGTPPLYVQGISVSAKSRNLPLALAFAEYVTNTANQQAFIKLAPGFEPGTRGASADSSADAGVGMQAQASAIAEKDVQSGVNFTPPIWTDAMNTILNQQIALAMTGEKSAKQALDDTVDQANALLTQ
ncbi:MAG TPA: extracellular solute-binding protein [Actinospica sp.]|jgi:multiple sugar transport system substrate-binding protein|nr:extracellular solute-binding protein [Actinospica sp.]